MTPEPGEKLSTGSPVPPRILWRLRLTICCAALMALAFLQSPGQIAPDSKLDLSLDPVGFLLRATHLWEPEGFFGQIQNQAYGYAWPVGPFFALGHVVGLDAWVVQRLWLTALLLAAFLGVVRLAGALRIGTPSARLVAGLAFALTPRLMTTLGPISVEALPTCIAPWVLLPLVLAGGRLSPRRAAMLSGLAFTFAGGVNAVAAIAALVVPGLWVLTRQRGLRGRLAGWWSLAVGLASLWWAIPLLLLGRYSPPFLDYIETAAVTTSPTSVPEVLRGTSHWVARLVTNGQPVWPAGWTLVHVAPLVLDTALIAGVGLAGLAYRRLPERRWLVLSLVTGVALVSFGHLGALAPPWAEAARALLDGPLAPFRNVHKFDVVLRLPLVLGLCGVLAAAPPRPWTRLAGVRPQLLAMTAIVTVIAVVGGAGPALAGALQSRGSFNAVPGYWNETAQWLDRYGGNQRALLVPGSRFGDYLWGRPKDEPLQALASSPWGVRDAVPLTPAGTIRLLDAVQERLATGRGSTALADVLARAGVGYIVVRNDLDRAVSQAPRPVLVHAALAASPGIRRVTAFGPPVGAPAVSGVVVDEGLDLLYRAVEIYAVDRVVDRVTLTSAEDVVLASGGPENLVALLERGWARRRPVVFTGDADPSMLAGLRSAGATGVVTDGLRRREVTMGSLDGNASATLTRDDPLRLVAPARDYLPWASDDLSATAVLVGARRVTASSSASDPSGFRAAAPARQPYSALDGDPGTAWAPRPDLPAAGQWWELDMGRTGGMEGAHVMAEAGRDVRPRAVLVEVDGVRLGTVRLGTGAPVTLPTEGVRGRVLRLSLLDGPVGIAEVVIPGVRVRRPIRTTPVEGIPGPVAVALDAADAGRSGCVEVGPRPLCTGALGAASEESGVLDRQVTFGAPGRYRVAGTAAARPGAALDALLEIPRRGAEASSAEVALPVAGAEAAFDDDVTTAWVAAVGEHTPSLTLRWQGERTVRGLRLLLDPAVAASRPSLLDVEVGGRVYRVVLDRRGRASFPATRAEELRVRVLSAPPVRSIDPRDGEVSLRPAGISEVVLQTDTPLPSAAQDAERLSLPCGSGPRLVVGGTTISTAVTATRAELRRAVRVPLRICGVGVIDVAGGLQEVSARPSAAFRGTALTLEPVDGRAGTVTAPGPSVRVERWDAEHRSLRLGERASASLLAVAENTNPGWEATLDGVRLRPVVIDGWRQGWWVPAGGAGRVTLVYAPGTLYRAGLAVGVVALLALVALSFTARRPRLASPRPPRPPAVVPVVLAGAVLVAATGAVGLACLAGAAVVGVLLPRHRSGAVLAVLAGTAALAGGVASAADVTGLLPVGLQGAGETGASIASVLALACVVAAVGVDRSGTSPFSRIAGRSTTR